MTSSPFERQITEPDTGERRTPTASTKLSDGPQQYPPGPSFLDHDRPAMRLVELPAWLQAFAASVGEPSVPEPAAAEAEHLREGVLSADEKPAPGSDSAPAQPASRPLASSGGFNSNFISEDDLPEWLRSIAPEETDDPGVDALLFGGDAGSEHVSVPNVARAWTTSGDARGVDESSSLFALVASQPTHGPMPQAEAAVTTRPQGNRPSSTVAAEPAGKVESYGSDTPPGMVTAEDIVASVMPQASEASGAGAGKRLPILPIAVAAALLLVLVAVALAMFVL